ncbi:hypothetical protein OA77_09585, partial [Pseudomonas coronafaciens]
SWSSAYCACAEQHHQTAKASNWPLSAVAMPNSVGMGGLDGELSNDRVSLGGPQSILLPSPTEGYDAQLNAIKSLVAEDPGRVAQVVKEWINTDE